MRATFEARFWSYVPVRQTGGTTWPVVDWKAVARRNGDAARAKIDADIAAHFPEGAR